MVTKFVMNTVLQHVGLSWIIETNQKLENNIDKHDPYQITCGTWYNVYICMKLHGTVFEIYIRNTKTEKYNIICSIDPHEKKYP